MIKTVFPHGAVEISNPENGENFKVNGHRLKPYLNRPSNVAEEVVFLHAIPHFD